MSYRIAISSFAAAAIGMSCIATDASARSGGGGGKSGGIATGVRGISSATGVGAPAKLGGSGVGGPTKLQGTATVASPMIVGVGGPTGGGAAGAPRGGAPAGAGYYAPASYDSNAACGRYPYPPCKKVPTR
jgi:hypothetical protein